jgi:hypothetical protein
MIVTEPSADIPAAGGDSPWTWSKSSSTEVVIGCPTDCSFGESIAVWNRTIRQRIPSSWATNVHVIGSGDLQPMVMCPRAATQPTVPSFAAEIFSTSNLNPPMAVNSCHCTFMTADADS